MTIVVDSNVVIDVLRARDEEVITRWTQALEQGNSLACSAITFAEVWRGVRPKEQERVEIVMDSLLCLPVDDRIGTLSGHFLRRFAPSHGLDMADAIIAATAVVHSNPLWTRNRKHYPMRELRLL